MKIGIDGNEANQTNRVGVGQFAFNVLKNLELLDLVNEYTVYLKENPRPDFPKERTNWRYQVFGPSKLWTQIALPFKLFTQKEKLDIFFIPSHYAPRFSPFPTVISIMDLWHHRHPEQFNPKDLYQLKNWEKYSVKKASRIITISEFTKSEIIKFYKYPAEKIVVAYPGFTNYQSPITKYQTNLNDKIFNVKNKYRITGDYLLYLGTLQPKKNVEGLIEAFSLVVSGWRIGDSADYRIACPTAITQPLLPITLVIAGKKGWLYEEIFEKVKKLGLTKKVIFTGFVEEEEKPFLMTGALAFVFPSFYEGFGIPVLEAMSLGVPAIISKEGSLPEVGGEAVLYFNPYDVKEMAGVMKNFLSLNKGKKDEIIKKGYLQVRLLEGQAEKFSWENCASKVLSTLESIK